MGKSPAHRREPLTLPILLLVVSSLLSFAGNLAAASVEADSELWRLLLIGAPTLAVLVIGGYLLWHLRRPLSVHLSHTLIDNARPCRGLVVLVSPGPGSESAKAAVRYHAASLKHVWLVHSDRSRSAATEVVEEISQEGVYGGPFETIPISDSQFESYPEVVRERIEDGVFQRLPEGVEESDVVIDVTGGRKATTAGAFLVALRPGRRMQIVKPKETDDRARATHADDPVEIVLDYQVTRC